MLHATAMQSLPGNRTECGPVAVLQRQCACGQHTVAGGECEECSKKRSVLQRFARDADAPELVPPIVHSVLRAPGQPIDAATRTHMEARLGHDFSRVRLHGGAEAAEAARAVNALAFTVGRDVVFGAGQYAPRTAAGRALLGHELAHVIQQRDGGHGPPQHLCISTDVAAEREADSVADRVKGGGSVVRNGGWNFGPAGAGVIQRQTSSTPSSKDADAFTDDDVTSCLEPYKGKSLGPLLKPGQVTVVEFSNASDTQGKVLDGILQQECSKHKGGKKPFGFYSIDVGDKENAELAAKYAQNSVPHLYVFEGTEQKYHGAKVEPAPFYALLLGRLAVAEADPSAGSTGLPRWATIGGGAALGIGLAGAGLGIASAAGTRGSGNVDTGAALGIMVAGGAVGALLGLLDPFGLSKRTRMVGVEEADMLVGKQFGKNLQKALVGATLWGEEAGLPRCQLNIVDSETFCDAFASLNKDPTNPFGAVAAKGRCKASVSGFTDSDAKPPAIWINADRAKPGTMIHEGLHLYSPNAFGNRFRYSVNEGTTEYFTRQITDREGIDREGTYDNERKEIEALVDRLGDEKPLRDAFFGGNINALVNAADATLGKGKIGAWQAAMQAEDWAAARQALGR